MVQVLRYGTFKFLLTVLHLALPVDDKKAPGGRNAMLYLNLLAENLQNLLCWFNPLKCYF